MVESPLDSALPVEGAPELSLATAPLESSAPLECEDAPEVPAEVDADPPPQLAVSQPDPTLGSSSLPHPPHVNTAIDAPKNRCSIRVVSIGPREARRSMYCARAMTRLRCIAVVLSLGGPSLTATTACTKANEVTYENAEHHDVGTACVAGLVDQANEVTVDFSVCQSSSCDEQVAASCTATLDGTTLTVEAHATIRSAKGQACTSDCRSTNVQCTTPALSAGTYTLVYGAGRAQLVIGPSNDTKNTCVEAS